jgi:hypothetical protein
MPTYQSRVSTTLPNGNFLPQIWSKKLNNKYYAQLCLDEITNHDWEGEIKGQGSSVLIRQVPTIDIFDHVIGQDMSLTDITDDKIELLINKAKYFNIEVSDIDAVQSNIPLMNMLIENATKNLKTAIEREVFAAVYADASNSMSTLPMDKTNVLDWIIDAGAIMEDCFLPADGRFIIIPPKGGAYLQKSDLKNVSLTGDDSSVMREGMTNGRLGTIAGITVYINSQLAKSGTTYQCIAGHKSAIAFASQINKVRHVQPTERWSEAVQCLNVYGFKTVLPSGLISMPAVIV